MKNKKIIGIGVDIADIGRFRKLPYQKNKSFYQQIFTKKEIDYCLKKADPYPSFAVRFAAKEAVIKALPKLPRNFHKIEILMKGKKPYVRVYAKKALISLSHTSDKAIAFAVIIK